MNIDPVEAAWLAHRRRLLDLSYRMLGSLGEAEDAVQETYARLVRHGIDGIDDVEAWLVAVASRVCLDVLRASTTRRKYVGPWLPEPLVDPPGSAPDPADKVTLDDSVRFALLAVLEQLSPGERVAFVLHDVFGLTFDEIADIVGRSPAATRKLASRARAAIRSDPEPRFDASADQARRVARAFALACATGDLDALVATLDADVVGEFDSGGSIPGAPLGPLQGARAVAATLVGAFAGTSATFEVESVNGMPGVVVHVGERVVTVISLVTDGHVIRVIRAVGNPNKLTHLNPSS